MGRCDKRNVGLKQGKIKLKQMSYQTIYSLARRARYKFISDEHTYFHFVFQGVRVEAIKDDGENTIICLCKGGCPKGTNKLDTYNDKIFYITDGNCEIVYDCNLYKKFMDMFGKYIRAHMKWT